MRLTLFLLVSFVTLTALPMGLMMMYEPDGSALGLSTDILSRTPFGSFFIPGLILALVIGGGCLMGLFLLINQSPRSYKLTMFNGILLIGWTIGQLLFTSYYHWIQGIYLVAGILITLTSYQLMGKAVI